MKLANFKKNLKLFQSKLFQLDKVCALMGAGSPEHPLGDGATSEQGIVFGHAYAILDVDEFEGEQLVMLRNPHGRSNFTSEWNGDWADESELWNERAYQKLHYKPAQDTDGVFWMSTMDFLNAFKYIYICRSLKADDGWYSHALQGEWKGPSSAGFPGKFRNLPQFSLTITEPCSAYISLRQKSGNATFRGKNYIAWVVQAEEGERINKINRPNIVAKSSLSNLSVMSGEANFSKDYSYPYTFTIMCGSKVAGLGGEG